jgi:hypothetical protein
MTDPFEDISIPTYVINLKSRTDRLEHVFSQFKDKPEFDIQIIEACRNKIGAVGLWQSIVKIINKVIKGDDDLIIICEDDHSFTEHYNKQYLIQNIIDAAEQGVELLSGGIGGFSDAVPITRNRYWIDSFWCTQFIVLYRPIFQKILDETFLDTDTTDGIFSELTSHKMVIYPFISIQHDFGYSDVTRSNNEISGMITTHFKEADKKMQVYKKVYENYLM